MSDQLSLSTPSSIRPRRETIPPALAKLDQWVAWRHERQAGKPAKLPLNPCARGAASVADPGTWGTLDEALAVANADGVGFMLTDADAITLIDIDDAGDRRTGVLHSWVQEWVDRFASYAEWSPSGHGIHIWIQGRPRFSRTRVAGVEVYAAKRYGAVTGDRLGDWTDVESRQAVLDAFGKHFFPAPEPVDAAAPMGPAMSVVGRGEPTRSDDEVLADLLENERNRKLFERCDLSAHGGDHSRADFALCAELARLTHDPVQIDRVFRRSGLMRSKWDREDYAERTIAKALGSQLASVGASQSAGDAFAERMAMRWWTEIAETPVEPQQWLVEQLLPVGGVCLLSGVTQAYKSWLAASICVSVATGEPWLDRFAVEPGGFLWIDGESCLDRIQKRFLDLGLPRDAKAILCVHPEVNPLRSPLDPGLQQLVVERNLRLIVVDAFTRFFEGEENNNMQVAAWMKPLRALTRVSGVTILIIDHVSKGSGELRGAVDKINGVDAAFKATCANNLITLTVQKQKEAERHRDVVIAHSIKDGAATFQFHDGSAATDAPLKRTNGGMEEDFQQIRALHAEHGPKKCTAAFIARELGLPESTARRRLRSMPS